MMKKQIVNFFMLILSVACQKQPAPVPFAGQVKVIGHGGAGFEAFTNPLPSNSLVSVRRAMEGLGADGVEVDVQLSSDGHLVLYHDAKLESSTSCQGCIPSRTLASLSSCRYKNGPGTSVWTDEPLATLEEVMKVFSSYQPKGELYLDVRLENRCGEILPDSVYADRIIEMIRRYDAKGWVVVESHSLSFLSTVRKRSDGLRLMLDTGEPLANLVQAKELELEGFVTGNESVDPEISKKLKEEGVRLVLFNVKTQSSVRSSLQKEPYAVQADNLELMQEYLR